MIRAAKHKGFLSIEVTVALGVLLTLIAVIAAIGSSFGKLNTQLWLRHTCVAAGRAQLDSIAILGRPIPEDKFHQLWPDVTCTVDRTAGQGQWQGLDRVQVHLSARSKYKAVTLELTRYLPGAGEVRP